MIELRWNGGVLEQRTRNLCVDATGAFCQFTEWSEWHLVPTATKPDGEPLLPPFIGFGGEGPGGAYYFKQSVGRDSWSLWTKGVESWTSAELRAIAEHQDWMDAKSEPIGEPIVGPNIPKAFPATIPFDDDGDDEDIMNSPPLVGIQRRTIELILELWNLVKANRAYAKDCLSMCGPGESPYPAEHVRTWAERERLLGDTLIQSMPELGPVLERILNLKGTL
jgi:hypothetical protein